MQSKKELSFDSMFKAVENLCRKAGLKLTHQRLEIYRELASRMDHPSEEAVHRSVQARMPTIALDTVYRTLLTFEEFGLVTRVYALDGPARFDANLSPHQHFACTKCKKIEDFHWEAFETIKLTARTRKWGDIKRRHAVLTGTCADCLGGENEVSQTGV